MQLDCWSCKGEEVAKGKMRPKRRGSCSNRGQNAQQPAGISTTRSASLCNFFCQFLHEQARTGKQVAYMRSFMSRYGKLMEHRGRRSWWWLPEKPDFLQFVWNPNVIPIDGTPRKPVSSDKPFLWHQDDERCGWDPRM
jgi:hypothetical protein